MISQHRFGLWEQQAITWANADQVLSSTIMPYGVTRPQWVDFKWCVDLISGALEKSIDFLWLE